MLRALVLVTLALVPHAVSGQAGGVLRVRVVLVDADGKATPVPRHALLVSENPVSAAPRRVVTGIDGTAVLKLRPGNYTVESDRPVTFLGKTYEWTQMVDITAARDVVLELTAENASIEPVAPAAGASAGAPESDPGFMETQWRDSVVAVWTPTMHASGFVIGANGLIATNHRGVGNAASVQVQVTPTVKVAAAVVAADPARDVAVLWVDPKAVALVRPVPLGCGQSEPPPLAVGQQVFALGVSVDQRKRMASATVSSVDSRAIVADIMLGADSGGPVFTSGGSLVGITSAVDEKDVRGRGDLAVVRVEEMCGIVASAETKMKGAAAASATHLPVEPATAFPADALANAAKRRAGGLSPYRMSSSTFDVAFITPVLLYAARHPADGAGSGPQDAGNASIQADRIRPLLEFSNWAEYVDEIPPVLLVRVTPKLVEGFWTTVARGAARTQGVSIPPIKRFTSGFLRLRAFCGNAEVMPIHPFRLEQRVSETDAIYEGLYVFHPVALRPECGTVKLELYSEKEPRKADLRAVDPKIIQQVWDDFAPLRGLNR